MLVRSCLLLALGALSLTAQMNSSQDLVGGAFARAFPSPFVRDLPQITSPSFEASNALRFSANSLAQPGSIKSLTNSERECAVPLTEMKTSKDRVFSMRKLPMQRWNDRMAKPPVIRACKG